MEDFIHFISEKYFAWFRDVLDIIIVSYFVYRVLLLIRGTRAVQLLRGLFLLFLLYFVANNVLQLRTITWIMQTGATFVLFSLPIIFQPELRRALASLGKESVLGEQSVFFKGKELFEHIHIIATAVKNMSEQKVGALIVIERETGLNEFIETGIPINAEVSSELIESIFYTGTPLHDGALVVKEDKIIAASVLLPLSENIKPVRGKHLLGTRHRAGLGLAETSDAFCIIVSEETGDVSIALHGKLHRSINEEVLETMLIENLKPKTKKTASINIKEGIKSFGDKVKNKNKEDTFDNEIKKEKSETKKFFEKFKEPDFNLKVTAFIMAFIFTILLGKGTFYSNIEKTYVLPLQVKYAQNVKNYESKLQVSSSFVKLKISGDKNNIENLKPDEIHVFVNIDKVDDNQRLSVNVSAPNNVTIKEISPRDVLVNTGN